MEKRFITVLNTEQQQQKHLPEFVILQVFCEVNFQFWFMNLTKEKKMSIQSSLNRRHIPTEN